MYKKVVAAISHLLSEIIKWELKKHDELRPKRLSTVFFHNPTFSDICKHTKNKSWRRCRLYFRGRMQCWWIFDFETDYIIMLCDINCNFFLTFLTLCWHGHNQAGIFFNLSQSNHILKWHWPPEFFARDSCKVVLQNLNLMVQTVLHCTVVSIKSWLSRSFWKFPLLSQIKNLPASLVQCQ
jgi:hypothetical protein